MSDPNDRPLAPNGGEPGVPEVVDSTARVEAERATAVDTPRPRPAAPTAMLIGVAVVALAAAAAVWFDGKRTQQALRVEVAQRLSEIESSSQASAKSLAQLSTDLREAQAKVALLEAR